MENLVIRKKKRLSVSKEEALLMGLRERNFSIWNPTELDVGNCFNINNAIEFLEIQENEVSDEDKAINAVWGRIMVGGKYHEANEEILALIKFLNGIRFFRINENQYVPIMPREIPKDSLAYEVSLLLKFGINLARIQKYTRSKPEYVNRYIKTNNDIVAKLREIHYQGSVSKQFKSFFKKKKGCRLVAITSGSLKIDECRVDIKTLDFLNKRVGNRLLVSRDPIITVFGWTLRIDGVCADGCIEVRPETLRALCGDTDGDNLIVTVSRDIVNPNKLLPNILDYYDMEIDDMIGEAGGICNKDFIDGEKHANWNTTLDVNEIKSRMEVQIKNLGYTKSATQRCGYWSIIMGQFISENIESLANELGLSVEEASKEYRFLLFKMQQSLTDAKHGTQDASLSLPFRLTDINLKFNNKEEIPNFLSNVMEAINV